MNWFKRSDGFTLIEVVLVVAIIVILATLALPSRLGQITQKRIIETIELVEAYKPIIENHYRIHAGTFPADNLAAGLPDAEKIRGNYLRKVEIRDGAMHLYLGQKLSPKLHNKIISIQPVFVEDSLQSPVSWICGYNKKPEGMVAAGTNLTDLESFLLPGRCR